MNEEKWKKSWAIKLDYELFLNSVLRVIPKYVNQNVFSDDPYYILAATVQFQLQQNVT